MKTRQRRRPPPRPEIPRSSTRFREYPKEVALAAGAFVAINANFYIFITFMIAYGTNPDILGLPQGTMLAAVLIASVFQIPALLFCAGLSDRMGRRGIYILGAILLGISVLRLLAARQYGGVCPDSAGPRRWAGVPEHDVRPAGGFLRGDLRRRGCATAGASLGYQIGSIFGGALAPLIATYLLSATGSWVSIAVYMAAMFAVSCVSVILLTETYQNEMDDVGSTEREGSGVEDPTPG